MQALQRRLHQGDALANEEFKILEQDTEMVVGLIREPDAENAEIRVTLEDAYLKAVKEQEEQVMQAAEEVFLQTRMISLQEVKRNLSDWLPSMKGENFTSNQAIQRVTKAEADDMMVEAKAAGKVVEMIPAMGVFSRKAGAGKRKSRIVCCGNYMADRSADELYASGADSTQVRAILRKAALES